ncbi:MULTISPECIES: putative baseplate assembly protein [Catenuloplanes]|uniref:Phage baseplate assembly protein n=1 Tax=Catenuloplanes niger TaxID=587534 RepID=A0AAE3ZYT0_9ACTN|nr:putative baseplate assembly protein [Catenuloplanes niger]MDR7327321.1 putative phage baseplate assembly protein [Catenuloplanes niger]
MSLTPPVLDDLTWDAMVEAARRRIPAESLGEWTLHAPVDPGITLVELLAYLLEQQLYRLDQVPDELVVAVLRLLGVPGPLPARPAGTVLALSTSHAGTVPAGTVLSRDPLARVTFTLRDDVTVLPVEVSRLIAGGRDRAADLAARRGVPLLATTGEPAEFRVELRATGPVPAGATLSLLVELDAGVRHPPSWSAQAADVPAPAALTWSWYRPDGDGSRTGGSRPGGGSSAGSRPGGDGPGRAEAACDVVDGTAGLRRSGIVTLTLPGERPVYGLRVRARSATFAAPPVLLALVPNAGAAEQSETRVADAELDEQTRAWLRLPGQHLTLPDARGRLLDAVLRIRRGGEWQTWRRVDAFTFAGPGDRVFRLDRETGELRFGDGLTGAIPVPDRDGGAVAVRYRLGGGTAGNGGRTANWVAVRGVGDDVLVTAHNPVPAEGGRDPETVAEARARAGDELAAVHRAVTAADFEELAAGTPGVAIARAHAQVGGHPAYPGTPVPGAVTVRIVPDVRRDDGLGSPVRPDPGMLAAVRKRLAAARLIGTEVFVCPPRYRRVALRVTLASRPADPAAVTRRIRDGLRRHLDPVVGDGGAGWPFGGPLRPSALRRVAQDAAGDTAEVTGVAIGLDGAPPAEDCADVPLRAGELVAAGDITVREGTR